MLDSWLWILHARFDRARKIARLEKMLFHSKHLYLINSNPWLAFSASNVK